MKFPIGMVVLGVTLALARVSGAEVAGKAAGEDSPAIGETSTNVGAGSAPVHQRGRTVHESSRGPLSGKSVHESTTGTVTSGPTADISRGAISDQRRPARNIVVTPQVEPLHDSDLERITEMLRAIKPLPRDTTAPPAP